jgi:hypothetical protein
MTTTVTDVTTQEISTTMSVAETVTYQQVASTDGFGCGYYGTPDLNGDFSGYVSTTDFDVALDSCLQTCASRIPVYHAKFNSNTRMSKHTSY